MTTKDPAKLRATQRRYRESNRDEINARKRAAYRVDPEKHHARAKKYRKENAERYGEYWARYQRRARAKLRAELLCAYGGVCVCCGEAEAGFLELDHIYGGGNEERRKFANTDSFFRWLRRNNWPTDRYQLLWANCNKGRARNDGVCPHKEKR